MKLHFEEETRDATVLRVAEEMAAAARTAPKGRGVDNMVIAVAGREDIQEISDHIKKMAERDGLPGFFLRDADNILSASAMVLLGTKIDPMGLSPCGLCGHNTCDEKRKYPDVPCAFNTGDLGIAIGSAAAVASRYHIDNRIMYTVGMAVLDLKLLGEEVKVIYAIPLSSTEKNPFFDRK